MLRLFKRRTPALSRILLVESGSRPLVERAIQMMSARRGAGIIDVVTCYEGAPMGLHEESAVFRVSDYQGRPGRKKLLRELRSRAYTAGAIVCSSEPILTKWKWWIAARLPVNFMVINENCDWFWIDRAHWRTIVRFMMFRAGISGGDAAGALGRFVAFPFMLLYLVAFALWIHARRLVRIWLGRVAHG